ncbi:MAG TPA: hypothetical protein PKX18_00590, partial [Thermosynergistes sp.]|nr:hypothetical protein [Thermosynergistes sp.]
MGLEAKPKPFHLLVRLVVFDTKFTVFLDLGLSCKNNNGNFNSFYSAWLSLKKLFNDKSAKSSIHSSLKGIY